MIVVIEVQNFIKCYKEKRVFDNIFFVVEGGVIYGLLGCNGVGKMMFMLIFMVQNFEFFGFVKVFGEYFYENVYVFSCICFVWESQKYLDDVYFKYVFKVVSMFFLNWDQVFVDELIVEFQLLMKQMIKKLFCGQFLVVGVIIGFVLWVEIIFFDELYFGFDVVVWQIFYDCFVEDYLEYLCIVILLLYLIDEVFNFIEKVIVIDDGWIFLNEDIDVVCDCVVMIVGDVVKVEVWVFGCEILYCEVLGCVVFIMVFGMLLVVECVDVIVVGFDFILVLLQQFIVWFIQKVEVCFVDRVDILKEEVC